MPTKWKYKEKSTANCYVNRLPFMDCTENQKLCSVWGRTGRDHPALDSSRVSYGFHSVLKYGVAVSNCLYSHTVFVVGTGSMTNTWKVWN